MYPKRTANHRPPPPFPSYLASHTHLASSKTSHHRYEINGILSRVFGFLTLPPSLFYAQLPAVPILQL